MDLSGRVTIVEVGPRDGLQNEPAQIPLETKIELVERLAAAGLPVVEAGAFVSPRRVPQMADSAELFRSLHRREGVRYPALVPNMLGLQLALTAGVKEIALFVSASEGFSKANIACSRAESIVRLAPVAESALAHRLRVRGYVSCVVACPYDGPTAHGDVVEMALKLMELGCDEISLGDTIGVGEPDQIRRLIEAVAKLVPREKLAVHFHDTYGRAISNIEASLREGISIFDSSVAGLGGCPFAPGSPGNVATEAVLDLMERLEIETGVDRAVVSETGVWIRKALRREGSELLRG
ncbi:MAG: hydroxymethylglutaryl-CoA lyase [Terracidiphilus sp.]